MFLFILRHIERYIHMLPWISSTTVGQYYLLHNVESLERWLNICQYLLTLLPTAIRSFGATFSIRDTDKTFTTHWLDAHRVQIIHLVIDFNAQGESTNEDYEESKE